MRHISLITLLGLFWGFKVGNSFYNHHDSEQQVRDQLPTTTSLPLPQINSYNYSCTKSERNSGQCRWCNREYPSKDGVWAPFPPYWQFPGKCTNQAFDIDDTRKCLTGRTVYAIGNSVSRQALFNLIEMLGGDPVSREGQRDQCPKVKTEWGDSCHNEYAGVKLKHLFLQYMDGLNYTDRGGFPYFRYKTHGEDGWTTGKLEHSHSLPSGEVVSRYYGHPRDINADLWEPYLDGSCVDQDMSECLKDYFAGSTERDIVVLTLGMAHGYFMHTQSSHNPSIDHAHWLVQTARTFRKHLAASFKGQVFRITHGEFHAEGREAHRSPGLQRVNDLLWPVWQPDEGEDRPWYTIDQWPINHGRHSLYDDALHFNGPLTHASMHQILNELCPSGGKTTWHYPLPGQTVGDTLKTVPINALVKLAMSGTRYWYMVVMNGTRHNVPDMDTLSGLAIPDKNIYRISSNDLELFTEGEPLVSCDPAWDAHQCKDSVYYKTLHGLPL